MNVLSKLVLPLLILGMVLPAPPLFAAVYYVSTTGSDSSTTPQNLATPWRTIAKAANTMVAGDTTFVRGGTYVEGLILFDTSGSLGNPISLLNYPNETPIITSSNRALSTNQLLISGLPTSGPTTPISDIVIQGFEITNRYEVKIQGTLRFVLRGNYIHDNYANGLTGPQTGGNKEATVDRNYFARNGNYNHPQCVGTPGGHQFCNQVHGLYILGTNWTITNNIITESLGYGIQCDSGVASPSPGAGYSGFSGLIANNTIAYGKNRAAFVLWANGVTLTNLTIENNILYENAQNPTTVTSAQVVEYAGGAGFSNVLVTKNLWYGTGNNTAFSNASAPAGVTIPSTGSNANVNANPLFVNAPAATIAAPDLRLLAGSPAIGFGAADTSRLSAPSGLAVVE